MGGGALLLGAAGSVFAPYALRAAAGDVARAERQDRAGREAVGLAEWGREALAAGAIV